jgi:hypothetical protein
VDGQWGPCEGEVGPTDEICDGLDNNCDGQADIYLTDTSGEQYCLSVVYGAAIVGQPIDVTVMAYHEHGICRFIQIYVPSTDISIPARTGSYAVTEWCTCFDYCETQFTLDPLPYADEYHLETRLYKGPLTTDIKHQDTIRVLCPHEYCAPDFELQAFVDWARQKGYEECVVSYYVETSLDYLEKRIIKRPFDKRTLSVTQPFVVSVYDVIPTDSEATYLSIGDSTRDCEYSPYWPDWCPTPRRADYLFLKEHFETTYGIRFDFNYTRLEIDYSDTFGEPELVNDEYYRFGAQHDYVAAFDTHSIVHYAVQYWNGLPVGDMTGGTHVVQISWEPWNVLGVVTYTHEWGHTLDWAHSFYGAYPWTFVGLDGVMNNTYGGGVQALGDPLSPMERYAFEPADGYQDEATFATFYNAGIIGSDWIPVCGHVDPALLDVTLVRATPQDTTYQLQISNLGDIIAGFVKLSIKKDGQLVEQRVLDYIHPDSTLLHNVTIDTSHTGVLAFILDEPNEIDELNEANNAWAGAVTCGDANFDAAITASDIIYLVNFVFKSGPAPIGSGDVNNSGEVNSADIIYMVGYVFKSGPPPVEPCGL